jgi:hypothetical protein
MVFLAMKSFAARSNWIISDSLIVLSAIVSLWASRATGQGAVPTTVQVPTFHYFTSTGSVLVPDGGDVVLGDVDGATLGRIEQGIPGLPSRPLTNSSIGSGVVTGNVSVSAQIHDFEAMDQALLGKTSNDAIHPPLARGEYLDSARRDGVSLQSVAVLRAKQAAEDADRDREAAAALARGRELQVAGKLGVAKIYFQTATKQSTPSGEVHKQAVAALAAVEQSKAAAKVAGQ